MRFLLGGGDTTGDASSSPPLYQGNARPLPKVRLLAQQELAAREQ